MAYAQLEQWENAEQTTDSLTIINWPHMTRNDVDLLYRVLETIRQNSPASKTPDSYIDDLKQQVEAMGRSAEDLELDPALLCSAPLAQGAM
jgi:uridine kinase